MTTQLDPPTPLVKPDVLAAAHRVKGWFAENSDHYHNHLAEYFVGISRGDEPCTTLAHENTLWILSRSAGGFTDDMLKLDREFDTLRKARGEPQDPSDMPTQLDPTDADHIAVKISTNPDFFTPGVRSLAKAYESQRERIADLEEDVERLRPKEAFVPEVLYSHCYDGDHMSVETDCRGGLQFTLGAEGGDNFWVLCQDQATQLTTALLKWSGVGGVEWEEIRKYGGGPAPYARVLLASPDFVFEGHFSSSTGHWVWTGDGTPTHWAPLPKPPVVKS